MSLQKSSIITVCGEIPEEIPNGAILNILGGNGQGIYNMGFQPARFIYKLPKWVIKKYAKNNDVILDPFVGSGTTLIEAMKLRRNAIGMDYNPLSFLISKVKTTYFTTRVFLESFNFLEDRLRKTNYYNLRPIYKAINFWFSEESQKALSNVKANIKSITNESVKDFFWLTFSQVVRKASRCGDGQLLTARRKNFNNKSELTKEEIYNIFLKKAKENFATLSNFHLKNNLNNVGVKIILGDAKALDGINKTDLIITSPPYINAIDYVWASKLELHWLDKVKATDDRLNLYKKEVGTERFEDKEYKTLQTTGYPIIDKKIEDIFYGRKYQASGNQNKLRAKTTSQYFIDMKTHFKKAYKLLPRGGIYALVMGDNKITKVEIPTADFLSLIAQSIGFEKLFEFWIILKNRQLNIPRNVDWASTIKHDKMIILRKS